MGLLISWATPAASVPRAAALRAWTRSSWWVRSSTAMRFRASRSPLTSTMCPPPEATGLKSPLATRAVIWPMSPRGLSRLVAMILIRTAMSARNMPR